MKTREEIVLEARRLEQAGRQQWVEYRRRTRGSRRPGVTLLPPTLPLFAFPASRVTRYQEREGIEEPHTHLTWRWIEVVLQDSGPRYDLVHQWTDLSDQRGRIEQIEPFATIQSDSVEEVLREGYEAVEADRLTEALAPYLDRLEANEMAHANEPALVAEVERIVETGALPSDARLRAKTDIVALLEGRLEPGEFITASIERHRPSETAQEVMAVRPGERLMIDEP